MNSLDEYRQHIRLLALKRGGDPIYNASVEHASVVIEEMFARARKQVDILSGSLNARVYGRHRVIEEARLFLASSHTNRLRIIVESDSLRDREIHPFFRAVHDYPNIKLRTAPSDVQDLYGFHFLVVDTDCYRFERDKKQADAIATFGDRRGAQNIKGIFEQLWERCSPVTIMRDSLQSNESSVQSGASRNEHFRAK